MSVLRCAPKAANGDHMSKRVDEEINEELSRAEKNERCCTPERAARRRAMRGRNDAIIEPIAGLFARRETWGKLNPSERTLWLMRSLARRHDDWTFCGASAAVAYGLPVTWGMLTHVFASVPQGTRGHSSPGIARRHLKDDEAFKLGDLRITSLWRTVFDCLATFPAADALAIVDRAARLSAASARQVVEYLRTAHRGGRHVRRAIEVAALADGRAESGGESIARHVMHELGFAPPELQVWIEDPVEPGKWFRVDFLWLLPDGSVIIGELDGRQKSERPELMGGRSAVRVLQDERLRESHLTALRPAIVRFDCETARDPARLGPLLESYGVPRRTRETALPPATRTVNAQLEHIGGWRVLATDEVLA